MHICTWDMINSGQIGPPDPKSDPSTLRPPEAPEVPNDPFWTLFDPFLDPLLDPFLGQIWGPFGPKYL